MQTDQNQVSVLEAADYKELFCEDGKEKVIAELVARTEEFDADTSTKQGRTAIRKLGAEINKIKDKVDERKKSLTEEWRKNTKEVNDGAKIVIDAVNQFRTEKMQPLVEWQEQEDARLDKINEMIEIASEYSRIMPQNLKDAEDALEKVKTLHNFDYEEKQDIANQEIQRAKAHLETQLQHQKNLEAQRAELEKERKAAEEARQKAEAERMKVQAEADAKRKAEEAIEAERRAEQQKALAEERRKEAEHQAQIQAERKKAQLAQQELQRKEAEERRISTEKKAREDDKNHKKSVHWSIINYMISEISLTEEQGKAIIKAIHQKQIPNISIEY